LTKGNRHITAEGNPVKSRAAGDKAHDFAVIDRELRLSVVQCEGFVSTDFVICTEI